MRSAHTVEQVRAAEESLLATLPEGALMQRAAAGLATSVIDLLGGAYGRRVLLLVGSGDNGGDALYAGAMLARRGARVQAVAVSDAVHEAGLAALRAAGGGRVELADLARPDVVLDGIVGIGGRPGLRDRAAEAVQRRERRTDGRGGRAERRRRGHRPARRRARGRRPHGDVRHPQGLPSRGASSVGVRRRPARRPRARPAGGGRDGVPERRRRPRSCRGPRATPRSTHVASSASGPDRSAIRAPG